MSNIKERIKSLKEDGFFKEMQVTNIDDTQIIYVIVQFPNTWLIDEEIEERFKVTYQMGKVRGEYYFCSDMENGFECVFDAIEYNIKRMRDAQERAHLLKDKVEELKEIFENEENTLEALRTLEFTFSDFKRGKRNSKGSRNKTDEVNENNEEDKTED